MLSMFVWCEAKHGERQARPDDRGLADELGHGLHGEGKLLKGFK